MATEQAIPQQPLIATRIRVRKSPSMLIAAGVGLALLSLAFYAAGGFKAIRSAYRYLRGETILVDSNTRSFGVVAPGDPIAVSFKLTNTAATPVRIAGCEAGCGCVIPADLPFVLNPKESRDFLISIRNPNREGVMPNGSLSFDLNLFTTNPAQPRIELTVKGEIRHPLVSSVPNP